MTDETITPKHYKLAMAAAKDRIRDLNSQLSAANEELAKVHAFIHARHEFVGVLRQYSTEDMADYHRWSGHAEARRSLAEDLGLKIDEETGGLAGLSGVAR